MLTILIPNYNRPRELARLLASIFVAIDRAEAADRVRVLVVDDHSPVDLAGAVGQFQHRRNFRFTHQRERCGNAERAALEALDQVETDFVWLVGNDDVFAPDAVGYVLRYLESGRFGFVLLNPALALGGQTVLPLCSTSEAIAYGSTAELFADFGFVTSTTTFSCLIFRRAPVASFHASHNLCNTSTVYSHTFTFFGALHSETGLFLSRPIVKFTQNAELDEREKLRRQAPAMIEYYHQSLGLARLMSRCADLTPYSVADLGRAAEDEISKADNSVQHTLLSHFLMQYVLSQMIDDLDAFRRGNPRGCLLRPELEEITAVVRALEEPAILQAHMAARGVQDSALLESGRKIAVLSKLRETIALQAPERYAALAATIPPTGVLKVITQRPDVVPLRGAAVAPPGRAHPAAG